MVRIVGIGEYIVSDNEGDTIKTFALASCVAVTVYCPKKKVAGMVHTALPSPISNQNIDRPGYYATTGVPLLIKRICQKHECRMQDLIICMYGGANSVRVNDKFSIGRRNIDAVIKVLTHLNIRVYKKEIGGTVSRTIEMDVATGEIRMSKLPIII